MDKTIRTKRLFLRQPTLADANWIHDALGSYEIAKNMLVPHPFELDHAIDWLSHAQTLKAPIDATFCIEHKDHGNVGSVSFRNKNDYAQLGYWLDQKHWGFGIMSQAVKASVDWYYANTKADIITSGVFHFNMASLAVQHKLGFVEIGRSQVYCPARGEDIEHIDTELTRDAFEAAIL